jgi:hypothetical protein
MILDFTNDFPRAKKKSQIHQISKKRIPLYNPTPKMNRNFKEKTFSSFLVFM